MYNFIIASVHSLLLAEISNLTIKCEKSSLTQFLDRGVIHTGWNL